MLEGGACSSSCSTDNRGGYRVFQKGGLRPNAGGGGGGGGVLSALDPTRKAGGGGGGGGVLSATGPI